MKPDESPKGADFAEGSNVFVYGSLRKGFGNHYRLGGSKYLGLGSLQGAVLYDLGYFPGLILTDEPGHVVHGEVYSVEDASVMASLDALEGHPDFYKRELLSLVDGTKAWVYVYQYDCIQDRLILSGDWTNRNAEPIKEAV